MEYKILIINAKDAKAPPRACSSVSLLSNPKSQLLTPTQRGVATLPAVMVLGVMALIVAVSVTTLSFTELFISQGSAQSSRAQFYAESGARDALIKIARNKTYLCPTENCYTVDLSLNGCSLLNDCAKVQVTGDNSVKTITSVGNMKASTRKLQVIVALDSNGGITNTSWSENTSSGASGIVYSITASAGSNGSITPAGITDVAQGDSPVYAITPNIGYQIDTLTIDGVPVAVAGTYTFTNVQATHTISAAFSAIPASIVEFMHQYNGSGIPQDPTGYTFAAQAQVGDVVLIAVQGATSTLAHSTVRDSLSSVYDERAAVKVSGLSTDVTIRSAPVTVAGTLTVYITSIDGDLGFSAYLLRGYSSAVPNAINYSVGVTTSPSTVSLTTTQQSSVFMFWGNEIAQEIGNTFTSWTSGFTESIHDSGHYDAAGYQLHVTAGSLTPGYNAIAGNASSILIAVALPENI